MITHPDNLYYIAALSALVSEGLLVPDVSGNDMWIDAANALSERTWFRAAVDSAIAYHGSLTGGAAPPTDARERADQ